jgi:hypothetical protein
VPALANAFDPRLAGVGRSVTAFRSRVQLSAKAAHRSAGAALWRVGRRRQLPPTWRIGLGCRQVTQELDRCVLWQAVAPAWLVELLPGLTWPWVEAHAR